MTRESVIDRIRKLLALGDSTRNNSSAEAELAASMAAKLMDEHRIAQLELVDIDSDVDELIKTDLYADAAPRRKKSTWQSLLASAVARVNGCRVVNSWGLGGRRSLLVLGRQSNVDAVNYLFSYLKREIERLAKIEAAGCGRGFVAAFKLGMATRIHERLDAEQHARQQARSGETTALVQRDDRAVDQYVARIFPSLRTAPPTRYSSAAGMAAGRAAGNRVSLGGGKGLRAPAQQLKG